MKKIFIILSIFLTACAQNKPLNQQLLQAILLEDSSSVKKLLIKGANPNYKVGYGTPIYHFIFTEKPECDSESLSHIFNYASVDLKYVDLLVGKALNAALIYGDPVCVKMLMENDAEVTPIEQTTGISISFWVLGLDDVNVELVKYLHDNGVDFNSRLKDGLTSLMMSAVIADGAEEISEFLLSIGLDKCDKNLEGKTAHDFVKGNRPELRRLLLCSK